MTDTKNSQANQVGLPYEAQMSDLREKLAGRPYCKAIKDILPELSKAQIRNLVNGRGKSELVLSALKIVVHKMDSSQQQAEKRVGEALAELGIAA